MNHIFHQQTKKPSRGRTALVAALAIGCLFGTVNHAAAQTVTPPPTPTLITPPAGNTAFLVGHALGTQGYVCLPTAPGRFHRVLDRQRRPPGSHALYEILRAGRSDHHPFSEPG